MNIEKAAFGGEQAAYGLDVRGLERYLQWAEAGE